MRRVEGQPHAQVAVNSSLGAGGPEERRQPGRALVTQRTPSARPRPSKSSGEGGVPVERVTSARPRGRGRGAAEGEHAPGAGVRVGVQEAWTAGDQGQAVPSKTRLTWHVVGTRVCSPSS